MENKEIARYLKKGARLLELYNENSFKIRSYKKAADAIEMLEEPVAKMGPSEVENIEGVGKNIAKKALSLVEKGTYEEWERLQEKTPEGVKELLGIKGIGPQKIRQAWDEQGIVSPEQLLEACRDGTAANIKGFGQKTVKNIREILEYALASKGKFLLSQALSEGKVILETLQNLEEVEKVAITGPLRRRLEVIQTLDFLVKGNDQEAIESALHLSGKVFRKEGQFYSYDYGIPVHLYHDNADQWAKRLLETTGSPEHVEQLRKLVNNNFANEEDFYRNAGYPFIIPEMREGHFEWESAPAINPNDIIADEHLKGVLHNHTNFSDGKATLFRLAEYCKEQGYEYLGVADHSQSASYAGGLTVEEIEDQWRVIDEWNSQYNDFKVLKGIESDILKDGSLDYEEDVLKGFDYVVASVHSGLKMSEDQANQRLITAIENPYTSVLGHCTGRLLLSRQGYPLDHQKVIDACAANNVVIEINAHPQRLDIDWRWLDYAMEKGVYVSINPDAHSLDGIHYMSYGVMMARKAGVTKDFVLNALPLDKVLEVFRK